MNDIRTQGQRSPLRGDPTCPQRHPSRSNRISLARVVPLAPLALLRRS